MNPPLNQFKHLLKFEEQGANVFYVAPQIRAGQIT